MVDKVGGISAVKTKVLELITAADSSLFPQATHVHPNWKTDINYLNENFPVVTIRVGNADVSERVYGRQIGGNSRGTYAVYTISAHVWDEKDTTDPTSKSACDLADKIVDYLLNYSGDSISGICYFSNLTIRESEPDPRGPQRLSRVIIEGLIFCKRIMTYLTYLLTTVVTHGSVNPSAGSHIETTNSTIEVTYTGSGSWSLRYWELDGVNVGDDSPYTVTMDTNHTIEAIEMGEQMTNGGFETGDLTGWSVGFGQYTPSVSDNDPHSGNWCVHIFGSGDWIKQVLSVPISRSSTEIFEFYAKSPYNNFDIILNFNDDTFKTRTGVPSGGSEEIYYKYDILTIDADGGGPLFPTGKTLISITIRQYSDNTLSVDDVSLIA